MLPRAEFDAGSRYSDFDPDLDQVAAYGIGGLIAGKVLANAELFAGLLKLLIASKAKGTRPFRADLPPVSTAV